MNKYPDKKTRAITVRYVQIALLPVPWNSDTTHDAGPDKLLKMPVIISIVFLSLLPTLINEWRINIKKTVNLAEPLSFLTTGTDVVFIAQTS